MFWYLVWNPTQFGAHAGGPQKSKKSILGKSKMASNTHIVPHRKKFRNESEVSMNYTWIVPNFLPSNENLKH